MNGHWLWAGVIMMVMTRLCLCLVYEPEELRERRKTLCYIAGMTAFGMWCGYAYSDVLNILLSLLFGILLFWGATIDKRYWILPNSGAILLVLAGVVRIAWQTIEIGGTAIVRQVVTNVGTTSFIAIALWLLGLSLRHLTKNGIGCGDIKWIASLAFWFSPYVLWFMLLLAFTAGAVWSLLARNRCHVRSAIPFGPFLCGASLVAYTCGVQVVTWYGL